ncbi:hypothetical protein P692DRAFT_20713579, partial [Suillus brevipes Sb2]
IHSADYRIQDTGIFVTYYHIILGMVVAGINIIELNLEKVSRISAKAMNSDVFPFRLIGPTLISRLAHGNFSVIDQGVLQQYMLIYYDVHCKSKPDILSQNHSS